MEASAACSSSSAASEAGLLENWSTLAKRDEGWKDRKERKERAGERAGGRARDAAQRTQKERKGLSLPLSFSLSFSFSPCLSVALCPLAKGGSQLDN